MKEWIIEHANGGKETIVGSDKYQEIKYDKDSNPYVRYRNQRIFN